MKLKFNFIFDSAHVNNKTWIIKKEENQRVTGINKKTKKMISPVPVLNSGSCCMKKKDGILDIY